MKYVQEIIDNYRNSEGPYALQIDGDWGVGKTYYIKNQVMKSLKEGGDFTVYFSVYGYDSLKQIQQDILLTIITELYPSKKILSRLSSFNKGWYKILKILGDSKLQSISLISDGILELITHLYSLENSSKLGRDNSLVVIIDDLERLSKKIQISDLLGFIGTELLEKIKCKVIIVSNSAEIKESEDFEKAKEKIIYRTVKFKHDISVIEEMILNESSNKFIKENRDWITSVLEDKKEPLNIRTLLSIIDNYSLVENQFSGEFERFNSEKILNIKKSIFLNIYVITNEYKLGVINENNLSELNRFTESNPYYLDLYNDTEKLTKTLINKYHGKNPYFDEFIFYSTDINNFILFGYLGDSNYLTEWSQRFEPTNNEDSSRVLKELWSFREKTDTEVKILQQKILADIIQDKYDLEMLMTAYGQLDKFDQLGLLFLDSEYVLIIEEKILQEYVEVAKSENTTVEYKIESNPQIDLKEKNPELLKKLKDIDRQLNRERLSEFIEILFSGNRSEINEAKLKVSSIKSNIIKQMLEEDTINKYIVIDNNKSQYFKELIDSAYIDLNSDIDEHKTFISDLNYSFENKQLGKIDTFKIKQLIESLNKAG
ncbi:P-loop NTPase fold protein [Enterococcus hirae]